jgi:hypothetical protein
MVGINIGMRPEGSRRSTLLMTSFQSSADKEWSLLCFACEAETTKKKPIKIPMQTLTVPHRFDFFISDSP